MLKRVLVAAIALGAGCLPAKAPHTESLPNDAKTLPRVAPLDNSGAVDPVAATSEVDVSGADGIWDSAASHTNASRTAIAEAGAAGESSARQAELLLHAGNEYDAAARDWARYMELGTAVPRAKEARFWHADALRGRVQLRRFLAAHDPRFPPPTPKDIEDASAAAKRVRDEVPSGGNARMAARWVITLSDIVTELEFERYEATNGMSGVSRPKGPRFDSVDPDKRNAVVDALPRVLLDSIAAREAYLALATPQDLEAGHFAFQVAEWYYVHGQLDRAWQRLLPIHAEYCGEHVAARSARSLLVHIARLKRDPKREQAATRLLICRDPAVDH